VAIAEDDEQGNSVTEITRTVLAARLRGIVQAAAPAGPNNTELFLSLSEFRSLMEQVGGIIQRLARRRPPKSWRVCPACYGRATKIFSLNTGRLQCQQCDHEYDPPEVNRDVH
jgi:hypothetical protein